MMGLRFSESHLLSFFRLQAEVHAIENHLKIKTQLFGLYIV